jgi:hypothetical protein
MLVFFSFKREKELQKCFILSVHRERKVSIGGLFILQK